MNKEAVAQELVKIAKLLSAGLNSKEYEILEYLYGHRTATPYEIYKQFNLDIKDAAAIRNLMSTGMGSDGKGEKWMLSEIGKILLRAGHGSSSLDGLSKDAAKRKVNDLIAQYTKGIFHGESWEPINRLWNIFRSAAIDFVMTGSQYRKNESGVLTSKEWKFEITFSNNNGRETILYGIVIASGAGSVQDPLEKYDIISYVS